MKKTVLNMFCLIAVLTVVWLAASAEAQHRPPVSLPVSLEGAQLQAFIASYERLRNAPTLSPKQRQLKNYRVRLEQTKLDYVFHYQPLRPARNHWGWRNPNGIYISIYVSKKSLKIRKSVVQD